MVLLIGNIMQKDGSKFDIVVENCQVLIIRESLFVFVFEDSFDVVVMSV